MSSIITPDSGHLVIKSSNDLDLNNLSSDDAALYVEGGGYIDGNLYIGGTLVANGDIITLGNTGGSLTLNSNISSDLLPSITKTYDIGDASHRWYNVYATKLHAYSVRLAPNPPDVTTVVDITQAITHITSATSAAVALQDGDQGQVLSFIVTEAPVSSVILTPANPMGYANIVLTNVGDSATLVFTSGAWAITSVFRASVNN
jgi:hypothetical protein